MVVFIFEFEMGDSIGLGRRQRQSSNRTGEDNGPVHTGAGILIHSGDRHSPRHWGPQYDTIRH